MDYTAVNIEKSQIKSKIKSFLESKYFIILIVLCTLLCWYFNWMYLEYILLGIFVGLIGFFRANLTTIISLLMLLHAGFREPILGNNTIKLTIMIIIVTLGSLLFLFRMIQNRKVIIKKILTNKCLYITILLIYIMLFSLINSPTPLHSLSSVGIFTINLLIPFFVCYGLENNKKDEENIAFSFIVFGFLIIVQMLIKIHWLLDTYSLEQIIKSKSISLGYMMSNHYSVFLSIALLFGIYLIQNSSSKKNIIFYFISILLNSIALIFTYCRGAFLGVGTVLCFYLIYIVFFQDSNKKRKLIILSLLLLTLITTIYILYKLKLLETIKNQFLNFNPSGRGYVYKIAIENFKDHFLIGTGYGTSEYYLNQPSPDWFMHLYNYHNHYLQILSTCGIFGGIAFTLYLFFFFKGPNKGFSFYLMLIGIYFFVHGMVDTVFFGKEFMLYFTVLYTYKENYKYNNEKKDQLF